MGPGMWGGFSSCLEGQGRRSAVLGVHDPQREKDLDHARSAWPSVRMASATLGVHDPRQEKDLDRAGSARTSTRRTSTMLGGMILSEWRTSTRLGVHGPRHGGPRPC